MIRAGKVLCHGPPDEVLNNPEAREYYFGENIDIGHRPPPVRHPGQPRRVERRPDDGDGAAGAS